MNKRVSLKILAVVGVSLLLLAAIASGVIYYVNRKAPILTLSGNETVVLEYGETYTEPGAEAHTVNRRGKETDVHVKITGEVGKEPGIYVLTYTAGLPGEQITARRTVMVQDTTPPEIILQGASRVELKPDEVYTEGGYTASDDHDGDITSRVRVTESGDSILYEVTDEAGNTASAIRAISRIQIPPTITLEGKNPLYLTAGLYGYADPGYRAEDSLDGSLTDKVWMEGYVNTHRAGSYTLTYHVTDSEGLTADCTREVIITPATAPETKRPEGKVIYLTFDDGPSENTERLLEILDAYEVKATWFVTACHEDYLDLLEDIHKAGHTVAIHTASHDYDAIYADEEAYFRDLREVQELILEETGVLTTLFRFPGGSSNTVSDFNPGIMTALTEDADDCGLTYFDWNVTAADTASNASFYTVIENIKEGVSKQDVSVVLQHDTRDYSVEAVEQIILWALEQGYTFLPLDATSPTFHHEVLN